MWEAGKGKTLRLTQPSEIVQWTLVAVPERTLSSLF